jgi:hypothetical protein
MPKITGQFDLDKALEAEVNNRTKRTSLMRKPGFNPTSTEVTRLIKG